MSGTRMQGTSRESLAAARDTLDTLVRAGDADLPGLAGELFAAGAVLDREAGLRRALTDSARSAEDRAGLARAVFGDGLSGAGGDLLVWAVQARWSAPRDLADAVELLAVEALVAAAQVVGRLDTVEDELFRTRRIVSGAPDLRTSLSDRAAPVGSRTALVDQLLDGKVSDETLRLVRQAVAAPRGRSLDTTLELYGQVAAERRERLVATVTAAVPLTEEQRGRLGAALARIYGHDVQLNVEVDPELLGGLRVEIGDEVIEGTVLSRLQEARRRLAG